MNLSDYDESNKQEYSLLNKHDGKICSNCGFSKPYPFYENAFTCSCPQTFIETVQGTDFCSHWEEQPC